MTREEQQYLIEQANNPNIKDIGEVSDGYHTFNSLYNQRLYLWAALVKAYKDKAWKTRCHHDGEPCFGGGWFLVGITTPAGDYTYHYELKDWDLFDCKVIDKAPVFDGHTDKDVTRVLTLQPDSHPQWIPVEERLPEKDNEFEDYSKLVIVTNGKDFWKGMYNYGGEDWRTFDLWLIDDATHWMEIVPPRKEE